MKCSFTEQWKSHNIAALSIISMKALARWIGTGLNLLYYSCNVNSLWAALLPHNLFLEKRGINSSWIQLSWKCFVSCHMAFSDRLSRCGQGRFRHKEKQTLMASVTMAPVFILKLSSAADSCLKYVPKSYVCLFLSGFRWKDTVPKRSHFSSDGRGRMVH